MSHSQAYRKRSARPPKPAIVKAWLQRAARESLALGLLLMTQVSLLLLISVVL